MASKTPTYGKDLPGNLGTEGVLRAIYDKFDDVQPIPPTSIEEKLDTLIELVDTVNINIILNTEAINENTQAVRDISINVGISSDDLKLISDAINKQTIAINNQTEVIKEKDTSVYVSNYVDVSNHIDNFVDVSNYIDVSNHIINNNMYDISNYITNKIDVSNFITNNIDVSNNIINNVDIDSEGIIKSIDNVAHSIDVFNSSLNKTLERPKPPKPGPRPFPPVPPMPPHPEPFPPGPVPPMPHPYPNYRQRTNLSSLYCHHYYGMNNPIYIHHNIKEGERVPQCCLGVVKEVYNDLIYRR